VGLVQNLYLYVVDGSDVVGWLDAAFTINEIEVTSVSDMVTKVLARLGSTRGIQNLFIGGHGAPSYQGIGSGTSWDTTGAKSLQLDTTGHLLGPAGGWLPRLARKFASGAIVTLGGCQVGKDPRLLQEVSRVLGGVPVQAGTDDQRPFVPGMEGDVVRCTPSSTTRMQGGWWGSPGGGGIN
jgi:hypothetical protein